MPGRRHEPKSTRRSVISAGGSEKPGRKFSSNPSASTRRPSTARGQEPERFERVRFGGGPDLEVVGIDFSGASSRGDVGRILMWATAIWSLSPTRSVCAGGSELLRTLPLPAVTRPSHIFRVTVAGSRNATHTDASVGSTRRTIGPARRRGSATAGFLLLQLCLLKHCHVVRQRVTASRI